MLIASIVAIALLLGMAFSLIAVRHLRRRRVIKGGLHGLLAAVFLLAALSAWLLAASLRTYQRLTHEQVAAEIQLTRTGDRAFSATITFTDGRSQEVVLRGDEWQIDARVLKWRGLANIAGFDTVYRLERVSGRYSDIESERREPRTVYGLQPQDRLDAWAIARRYQPYLPWIDALYGSATFLPMADDALYEISVSQTGLLARPLNHAARQAVGGWR